MSAAPVRACAIEVGPQSRRRPCAAALARRPCVFCARRTCRDHLITRTKGRALAELYRLTWQLGAAGCAALARGLFPRCSTCWRAQVRRLDGGGP